MPTAKPRARNRLNSTSDEPSRRVLRRSYSTKAASAGSDSAIETSVHGGQPRNCPCTSGTSSRSRASTSSTMPVTSTRGACGARDSPTQAAAATSAAAPTTRLMANRLRHCMPNRFASTSAPPTIGPATIASPAMVAYSPTTLPISSRVNVTWMIASTCGTMAAARAPCSTRAPMSISGLHAIAHSAEAAMKPPTPIRNIRLRPTMSPSRPPVMSSTAKASV